MMKTVKVRVQRVKFNRLVQKDIIHYKDFLVHDEASKCKEGDIVRIEYIKKFSRKKAFAVTEIMKNKGTEWMRYQQEAPEKVAAEEREKLREYQLERLERSNAGSTTQQLQALREIEAAQYSAGESESDKIKALREKYGITSWPPTHEFVELDYKNLKNELQELNIEILKHHYKDTVKKLLQEQPEKANAILKELGKEDVTKPSIKKNLLMKYYATQFSKA
ncbi:small ribosomal subunit protein uS17m [Trichomonascus vanleenenianus]|uniref:mitochondrial 37S ribosomal protein uS17m MRPS17 n=1 Tax=Trichomonascus vanleenenianus TaxID=2268995 RepID=UPI003ECA5A67